MSVMQRFSGTGVCDTHGPYEYEARQVGKIVLGRACPKCLRASHLQAEARNRELDAQAQQRLWHKRLQDAGIPAAFLGATLDTFTPGNERARQMLTVVRLYAENFKIVLKQRPPSGTVCVGVPGTGKTHVACGLVQDLMRQGYCAAYLSCNEFLLQVKEAQYGRSADRVSVLLQRYMTPHFLAADEFGLHTTNDYDYQVLFTLIDGRYKRNLPTMLASNMTPEELKKTADPRLMERVLGPYGSTLAFDWPTHRREGAQSRP